MLRGLVVVRRACGAEVRFVIEHAARAGVPPGRDRPPAHHPKVPPRDPKYGAPSGAGSDDHLTKGEIDQGSQMVSGAPNVQKIQSHTHIYIYIVLYIKIKNK